ncbi:MAG: hypothetical protein JWM62_124 [Frankiales bacterium]|nr:hypothetical protein [Frankiales bacterium]
MTSPKGRPTPKRSEKQRRTGPVAPPPLTRKEAAQRQKEAAAAARSRIKEGAARGDERYLAKRDAGPARALVRDVVDARRNVGTLLLPLALILIVTNLTGIRVLQNLGLLLWLVAILAMVADIARTTVVLRSRIKAEHPEETSLFGHIAYGLLRSTVMRRFRLPPPRVSPGRA